MEGARKGDENVYQDDAALWIGRQPEANLRADLV